MGLHSGSSVILSDQLKNSLKKIATDCQEKAGASASDIQALKNKRLPQTETGLCMLECVFNKVKIMNNGQFDKDGLVMAATPLLKGDIMKLRKLKDLADFCDQQIGRGSKGKCQNVKLLVNCVYKHGRDYGLKIPTSM